MFLLNLLIIKCYILDSYLKKNLKREEKIEITESNAICINNCHFSILFKYINITIIYVYSVTNKKLRQKEEEKEKRDLSNFL